ncbi:DUF1097 domain-containing protein [Sedimenticola hydrogenitrophicus]|uniref:DUF1097 domain-containing protein n=1 Tax=Sedimenticola hydrogenitrophicus TaxID=2967975 RepID=UPI0023B0FC01|nr:DUF1097 domain-containing protein [Sedimenticola hydrogenitrophicus]
MSLLIALSISISLLGGIATWAFLSAWSGPVLIWAAFVAWGCFYHSGGDDAALKNTIVGNIFGVVCAWTAAVVILLIPLAAALTLPVWAGIVVGTTVLVVVLAAHIPAFSVIPASVYGYASTFAFLLQTPQALTVESLTTLNFGNALLIVPASMILGALFGYASAKLGGALVGKAPATA